MCTQSRISIAALILLLVPATLACQSGPGQRWYVEGFHSDVELGEVTFDFDDSGEIDIEDLERKRTGVRTGTKSLDFGWHVQVFSEEFDAFDLVGLGGGVSSFSHLFGPDEGIRFGLVWGVEGSFSAGDTSESDIDIVLVDLDSSLGFGADIHGLRPSAGLALNLLAGAFDTFSDEGTISAANLGLYVGADYISASVPVIGRVRFFAGDIEGFAVTVGVRF